MLVKDLASSLGGGIEGITPALATAIAGINSVDAIVVIARFAGLLTAKAGINSIIVVLIVHFAALVTAEAGIDGVAVVAVVVRSAALAFALSAATAKAFVAVYCAISSFAPAQGGEEALAVFATAATGMPDTSGSR